MVTLLGLSHSVDTELERVHYHRIQQIAYMATVAIAAAILLHVVAPTLEDSRRTTADRAGPAGN